MTFSLPVLCLGNTKCLLKPKTSVYWCDCLVKVKMNSTYCKVLYSLKFLSSVMKLNIQNKKAAKIIFFENTTGLKSEFHFDQEMILGCYGVKIVLSQAILCSYVVK